MIKEVKGAISSALYNDFKGAIIYTENVEQEFKKNSFVILHLSSEFSNLLGKRRMMKNSFCIHYFPENSKKEELNEIVSKLYSALDFISCENGNLLHATDMRAEAENNGEGEILHFYVDFNFPVIIEPENENDMEKENMQLLKTQVSAGTGNRYNDEDSFVGQSY